MISVIIPTYNRSAFLKRSIDSVLKQTYQNFELIICDDGSCDNSYEVIKNYLPKINYIKQQNKGVSSARNLGIKSSSHPLIAFLDSDDEWREDKLAKQIDFLHNNPHLQIVHTNEKWLRNNKEVNKKKQHKKYAGNIFAEALLNCFISPSSICMKKSLFDEYGFFAEDLPACEDYDLWLRLTAFNEIGYIAEELTIRHAGHQDQLSEKYWGMDRFRVIALTRILQNKNLSAKQQQLSKETLKKKISILLNGASKRSNIELISFCNRLKTDYLDEH